MFNTKFFSCELTRVWRRLNQTGRWRSSSGWTSWCQLWRLIHSLHLYQPTTNTDTQGQILGLTSWCLPSGLQQTNTQQNGKTPNTHKYVIKIILIKITIIMIVLFFKLDSLASSHPVSMPVQDPKEIEAIFDTISYKKVVIIWNQMIYHLVPTTRAPQSSTCWSTAWARRPWGPASRSTWTSTSSTTLSQGHLGTSNLLW